MDPKQKARDLIRLALDSKNDNERASSAIRAVEIIDRYGLLDSSSVAGGIVDTVAKVVARGTDPDFVEQVASRAEKFKSGLDRVVGVVGSVGKIARSEGSSGGRKRVRRYR